MISAINNLCFASEMPEQEKEQEVGWGGAMCMITLVFAQRLVFSAAVLHRSSI